MANLSSPQIAEKLEEIAQHGYKHEFNFANNKLQLHKELEDETFVDKSYVAEQVSLEAEYYYDDEHKILITFMTNDGEMGYIIDVENKEGEYPVLNYLESIDD